MNEKIDFMKRFINVYEQIKTEQMVEKSSRLFQEQGPLYKQNFASRFILVPHTQIDSVLLEDHFYVSRKIDGEMRTVYFDGKKSKMFSTGGKCEEDFPCLIELSKKLCDKGIKTAAFGAELNFVKEDKSRSRVTDVIRAIADPELHNQLALSPYDIIFLDGIMWNEKNYGETHKKLRELFDYSGLVQPVELVEACGVEEVKSIYEKWVINNHAEGLVVHPESNVIYKIKPQHTVDAVVVGFTTSEWDGKQQIRDLLFAVMDNDGKFRIFAHGGNGLTQNQRQELLIRFLPLKIESNYIYTDSRGIAFTMVRPRIVFETSAIDFSSQKSNESPNTNDILILQDNCWNYCCKRNGISAYNLSIIREREDKSANSTDIRTSQISDICPFVKENSHKNINRKPSVLLLRRVYKKQTKNSIYVKKFYLWKTNKEDTGCFPAFVLQYSYFSSRSKNLSKKVLVSSSVEQLKGMFDLLITKEIKKGWEYVQQI